MLILGINTYHPDSSACIVRDGELLAAIEEERFTRTKHWAGFPTESTRYCLKTAGIWMEDLDFIAINRDPTANLYQKALFTLSCWPSFGMIKDRLANWSKIGGLKTMIAERLDIKSERIKAKLYHVEHHAAHMSSAFMVSPFREAAVVSVDGFGDFVSTMWGIGRGKDLVVKDRIFFPHSLGLFYLAVTQYLGFPKYGDEYKVMGLAAYGKPIYLDAMRQIVQLHSNGRFKLNPIYFVHHQRRDTMTLGEGEPEIEPVYSEKMESLLGPTRQKGEPITSRHEDIAASVQTMYEEALFNLLNYVWEDTKTPNLCLAGGCALNSVANGKIFDNTPFREVYIQPAAGDAGGAIGAAYYVYNQVLRNNRNFVMDTAYWGPQYDHMAISDILQDMNDKLLKIGCSIEHIEGEDELCKKTAKAIADGKVVGWFQGRAEWGPRALGNRSIVADPRRSEMKDVLNTRIKRREPFRPFAPSIMLEAVADYFEIDYPDPFMIKVYPVKKEKREVIAAVTHVDGTGRIQTVSKRENPLYWKLIKEFERVTGVPVVLNTSFNENEPIVNTPREAIDCFLRTRMEVLVLGKYFLSRNARTLQ